MLALGTVICIISYHHPLNGFTTPKQPMETREIRVDLKFAKSRWPLSTKGASCPSLHINVPTKFLTQPRYTCYSYKNPWNWYGMITYIWVLFFCKPYVLAVQKQAWLSWQSHITVHPTINSLRVLFQMRLQSFRVQWIIDMNLLPSGQKSGWIKIQDGYQCDFLFKKTWGFPASHLVELRICITMRDIVTLLTQQSAHQIFCCPFYGRLSVQPVSEMRRNNPSVSLCYRWSLTRLIWAPVASIFSLNPSILMCHLLSSLIARVTTVIVLIVLFLGWNFKKFTIHSQQTYHVCQHWTNRMCAMCVF